MNLFLTLKICGKVTQKGLSYKHCMHIIDMNKPEKESNSTVIG